MPALNKVLLMGNLTRDPELRVTPKGTPICQFSLAINRQFKMESGETREEVIYVDIEAWGKQGETLARYTRKGRQLFVEGRLRFDSWERDGQKRSKLSVVVENFQFLDSGTGGGEGAPGGERSGGERSGGARSGGSSPGRAAPVGARDTPQDDYEEDIPF